MNRTKIEQKSQIEVKMEGVDPGESRVEKPRH